MEVKGCTETLDLDDAADVGVVRRRVAVLAEAVGLDETQAGRAALIATELASNVVKHAGHGGALLTREQGALTIATWDRGPGMNLVACLRDGMSTAGTAGNGLGAVSRLASTWDCYAVPGAGTIVVATVAASRSVLTFVHGAVCTPIKGEEVCGDAWDVHIAGERATILVSDGLGHGPGAAAASEKVIATVRADPWAPLPELLHRAHQAARSTRGAAATVVRIDRAMRKVTVAGVGNVAPWLVTGGHARALVTQHGTLGQASPTVREETFPFPQGAQIVVCSDGIKSRLEVAPLVFDHPPPTVAATVWRDLARGRDDTTVVVVREGPG
jgi:anti-sigma regulatory factor (Ser/Thr protein kinase)